MSCISEENYQMAVTVVRNHGTGSVSNLQRKMHWGYNQAATAIERMESEFIVGPMSESGRREVFPEQIHELWKEKESLKAHDTEITPEITEALDSEISQLENAFIEKHLLDNDEAEQLEMLIAKAMKLGELYAKRDAKAQAAKAKTVPEGFVLMPKEPADEIIEAMNEFDYRNDYSDMDGAYRVIVETLEKAQEDAELNAIADSHKDQKHISVNLDDL